jgi:hypothetical protein
MAAKAANAVTVLINTTSPGSTTQTFTRSDFPTGASPLCLAVEDLDGDGRRDLSTTNEGNPGTVSLLRSTSAPGAAPSFASKVDLATGSTPRSCPIGDLNGDGRPDLAVADFGSPQAVAVYFAN